MSTVSYDVLDYSILPYLSLRDMAMSRSKSPYINAKYQQQIQDLLNNGKDWEILAAGLETQDLRLLRVFFSNLQDTDDFYNRIEVAIEESINDEDLDLLDDISKYRIEEPWNYIPLRIFYPIDFERFERSTGYPVDDEKFNQMFILSNGPEKVTDEINKDIALSVELFVRRNSGTILKLLSLPRYRRNVPTDFLRKYGGLLQ